LFSVKHHISTPSQVEGYYCRYQELNPTRNHPTRECEVVCQSIDEPYPFEGSNFDAVIMLGVLEFIKEPATVAVEARRVLKKGGLFGLSVPQKVEALS